MKKIISILLILIGFVLFSYPIYTQYNIKQQQKQLFEQYEEILFENIENTKNEGLNLTSKSEETFKSDSKTPPEVNIESIGINPDYTMDYNPTNEDNSSTEDYINTDINDIKLVLHNIKVKSKESQNNDKKAKDIDRLLGSQNILGIIEINKIDLKMIVVEGTKWENIRVSIGHIEQTVSMGGNGNCVLAGHRGGTYGIFFRDIDKLEIDDEIKLFDTSGSVYSYMVYDKFITEPTDMSVIRDKAGEKTLTLISCEDNGTKRIIVHAKMD